MLDIGRKSIEIEYRNCNSFRREEEGCILKSALRPKIWGGGFKLAEITRASETDRDFSGVHKTTSQLNSTQQHQITMNHHKSKIVLAL
jgi:hypothetical protein